jgi:hypothetical protein
VKPITGQVKIERMACSIQVSQHVFDPAHQVGTDSARIAFLEQSLQSSMAERLDHQDTVPCIGTGVNK